MVKQPPNVWWSEPAGLSIVERMEVVDEDGDLEATLFARDRLGFLLPPGEWLTFWHGIFGVLAVDYMPGGWVDQIDLAHYLIRKVKREGRE